MGMRRTSRFCPVLLLLSTTLLLPVATSAEESVQIFSKPYDQFITSSTLKWIPDYQYSASKNLIIGGFEVTDGASRDTGRPIFICRAKHNDLWVAGSQKMGEKNCTVTYLGSVGSYKHYQLLENVEGAARISWNKWSKYASPPSGAVASDKLYVARHEASQSTSQTHYIGTLDSQDMPSSIQYAKEGGEEGSASEGQLLVEIEPISYELRDFELVRTKSRVVKREMRDLARVTIGNTGTEPSTMAEALAYSYTHVIYLGQGHAMLQGLNTSVTARNNHKLLDMKWGIKIRENRTGVHNVEINLKAGTAVNVTLQGEYVVEDTPYTGMLFSRYEDSASAKPRSVNGEHREEKIVNVKPIFGLVYYTGNNSLAPTIAPLPTITEAPTTVITMTHPTHRLATTLQQQQLDEDEDEEEEEDGAGKRMGQDDENNAIPAKQSEASPGMQSDDSSPLSLEEKPKGAAVVVAESLFLLAVATFIARVT
ncbi:protein unzipped [Copidosoma floridanum]|uniref:protein unzipped n=1 Tax=Copidosoma floridanum TaxID=29053 RepID=UPI0006C9C8E8|nr:protein unzipped [Copidosoma floridanum]XP_014205060.1 protein unzipped [Copidosoma floridanum]XP_014205061.1 protein unzipped [Copidosoma floridanum]XP_014205062.1 protein unzipped [Copidosoma floridanum]